MCDYQKDPLSKKWIVFVPSRLKRPRQEEKKFVCPFCPGNEHLSPTEVYRAGGGGRNKPGWQVRVISNKFPIVKHHEVIIHSPNCKKDIADLSLPEVELIFEVYRKRFNFYRKKGKVLLFSNHGPDSGSSLTHPHSQLTVIPFRIKFEALQKQKVANIVKENEHLFAYCPQFSQWPYEIWIASKNEEEFFGDISDEKLKNLAYLTQASFKKLKKIYRYNSVSLMPFAYNFYISPDKNWYLRIIPRFIHRAGFEMGTGIMVNVVNPKTASFLYKRYDEKMENILTKLEKLSKK